MADNQWVIDVDESGFAEQVLQRSSATPVLVDFWAAWCGPCRILGPTLEKLAKEFNGQFILAKIDSDRNKRLAMQWKVKGIPAVKLFVDGEVKDEFTGALPETAIRQFLDRALPSPADRRAVIAQQLFQEGDIEQAERISQDTLALDSQHGPTLLLLTQICLERGDIEDAKHLFARISPKTAASPEAVKIKARLAFSGDQGDLEQWHARITANPTDLQAKIQYGQALIGAERYAEGMDQLLEVLRKDRQFQDEAAKHALINTFAMLGGDHPLVAVYRSKMATVLFS
ncbi:MAG: tetratricopeptide repeat protein [Magnetococcales bacterium]|nr:tetratricopeptide repeat protein [Magnetococcales bacterium]